ncbi:MAG: hypothetical protein HY006_03675 [Candidatus Sungbacteria bacterium]|nr:hypothetical protein [Candidatus Sungbacteria bacterium]
MSQRQEVRLTMEQRAEIRSYQLQLQIELSGAVRDEKYTPKAHCPQCYRELTANEILAGFLRDVNDFTTKCSGCGHRFEPKLICFGDAGKIELQFYCGPQAQNRLRSVSHLRPADIAREYPSEYRSAAMHYGTVKAMFKEMGIEYLFDELEGWQAKVQPFLGRMPDTIVARCVGATPRDIKKLRQAANISTYTKRKALKEIKKSK